MINQQTHGHKSDREIKTALGSFAPSAFIFKTDIKQSEGTHDVYACHSKDLYIKQTTVLVSEMTDGKTYEIDAATKKQHGI